MAERDASFTLRHENPLANDLVWRSGRWSAPLVSPAGQLRQFRWTCWVWAFANESEVPVATTPPTSASEPAPPSRQTWPRSSRSRTLALARPADAGVPGPGVTVAPESRPWSTSSTRVPHRPSLTRDRSNGDPERVARSSRLSPSVTSRREITGPISRHRPLQVSRRETCDHAPRRDTQCRGRRTDKDRHAARSVQQFIASGCAVNRRVPRGHVPAPPRFLEIGGLRRYGCSPRHGQPFHRVVR